MTKLQEQELLRMYSTHPAVQRAETLGQRATRRQLEKDRLAQYVADFHDWELTPAGLEAARKIAVREQL